MTSEALTTAMTSVPSERPSSRTASTVIEETIRWPLASSSTLGIASPWGILTTLAGTRLRALIFIGASLSSGGTACAEAIGVGTDSEVGGSTYSRRDEPGD